MSTTNPITLEELMKALSSGAQAVVIVGGEIYDLTPSKEV